MAHITRHRVEEFSLQLSWTPKVNGVTPATPGFYVRASFANEGEATGVVKGTWRGGIGGNGSLVGDNFMYELFSLLEDEGLLEHPFNAEWGTKLGHAAYEAQKAALEGKRQRLEQLKAEVDALERELS